MNGDKRQALLCLRAEYKLKMAKKIAWLKNTQEWKTAIKRLNIEDYEFIAPHMGYLKQMIRLTLSSYTTSPFLLLTNFRLLTVTANHAPEIKHLCENGIGVLAIEKKSRKAVAYVTHIDLCDAFYANIEASSSSYVPSVEERYMGEIFNAVRKSISVKMPVFNDDMWNNEQQLRELWGVYTHRGFAFVSPHMKGSGLVMAMMLFLKILFFEVGYQRLFLTLGHPTTVNMMRAQQSEFIGSVDVQNFVFADGNSVRKLLKKHQKTYNFDDEFMQKMENALVLKISRAKKYDVWQKFLSRNIKIYEMKKAKKLQVAEKHAKKSKL